jgi:hypothetical protein
MSKEQELISLAKQHLTDYVNACDCESKEDVYNAIAVMLVVAGSVNNAQLPEEE